MTMAVIDATGHVVGRLSSVVAKRLLKGEEIVIVNAEEAIVTGRRGVLLTTYAHRRKRGSRISRMRGIGPFYPRRPDMMLRRTISRMLPHEQAKGREALRRLRVYVDVPEAYREQAFEAIDVARRPPRGPFLSLGEIARNLGSKFEGPS
jgi:ribosomal protein uL13